MTGDPVAGILLVALVGQRLEVTLLCVRPDRRRAGVGRALVAAAVARYPTITAWSPEPWLCEGLGLLRTGATRGDGSVQLIGASTASPAGQA